MARVSCVAQPIPQVSAGYTHFHLESNTKEIEVVRNLLIETQGQFMLDLQMILAIIRSDQITGEQTLVVDEILSQLQSDLIPDADVTAVINYLNMEMAHNPIDDQVKHKLGLLYDQLLQRIRIES